jgi:hypothetical protein
MNTLPFDTIEEREEDENHAVKLLDLVVEPETHRSSLLPPLKPRQVTSPSPISTTNC